MDINWDSEFAKGDRSLIVQNRKPTHETARNIFKDDRAVILSAAKKHGYAAYGIDIDAKAISFMKSKI